ncbi:MAG TPA: GGDEF domain-containing protein [Tepidisphaeraceae bacterium]|nr:GGDEF domain-containing protein [Tepidisphaeraceae bacterium]
MNEQLLNRVRQCESLPTLPAVAVQVLELVQDPDTDIPRLARLVSKDPALSSKILRTVNSSLYGRPNKISKLTQALTMLGLQTVRVLVLGFSLVRNVKNYKNRGFKPLEYWRRAIYSATAAITLAQRIHLETQEEAFVAALLMDLGMLVLDELYGEQYGRLCEKARTHSDLLKLEEQTLQVTHAEVSGALAELWALPPILATPMTFHHKPQAVEDAALQPLTQVCYLAGRCADVFVEETAATAIAEFKAFCQEHHGMSDSECDQLLNTVCRRTGEIAPLFDINLNAGVSYEEILKKANDSVIQLTLANQEQARQEATRLALKATIDALTGLSNRGRFDVFLSEEFTSALAHGRSLSLIMFDLDKFKSINDQHGHQAGDMVLQAAAKIIRAAARQQDLAARFGGEEMAIIMTGIGRADAVATAEAIRKELANNPIECGRITLPVTLSAGVASFEPGSPFREPAHLLKAADLALYAAKNAGRNCVRAFSLNRPVSGAAA